jgi:hypothetical protein
MDLKAGVTFFGRARFGPARGAKNRRRLDLLRIMAVKIL